MCFRYIVTSFWTWLLEDITGNTLTTVIILIALASIYKFVLEAFEEDDITMGDWRHMLYQRVRDDVDKLHRDIRTLRQQLQQDEAYGIPYSKPKMNFKYTAKLKLLKQELACFEECCCTTEDLETEEDEEGKEIPLSSITGWHIKCAADFHDWVISTEFSESELSISKIAQYQRKKGWRSSSVKDVLRYRSNACGGFWLSKKYVSGLKLNDSEIQIVDSEIFGDKLEKQIMSECEIGAAEEFDPQGVQERKIVAVELVKRLECESEDFDTQNMSECEVGAAEEFDPQGMQERKIVAIELVIWPECEIGGTEELDTQGMQERKIDAAEQFKLLECEINEAEEFDTQNLRAS